MRTLLAASFALSFGAAPVLADDAGLRAWSTFYTKGMNMGPNAGYATDAPQGGGSLPGSANEGTQRSPATAGQNPESPRFQSNAQPRRPRRTQDAR